ncbi:jg26415, partial [Pararge aegeria aegeria]
MKGQVTGVGKMLTPIKYAVELGHHDKLIIQIEMYRGNYKAGNGVGDSPRLDQLHPSMYPSNYNRSTPTGDSETGFARGPFRAVPTPEHHHPPPGKLRFSIRTSCGHLAFPQLIV